MERPILGLLQVATLGVACAAASSATTLVALWSPHGLLLGADSRVTTDFSGKTVVGTACKIGRQDSSFFAFSGLVDDRITNYHVESLAQEAIAQGGEVEAQLSRFLELAEGPLSRAVSLIRQQSPEQYDYLRQGHPVLQAIFGFVEHGPPVLAVAGFGLTAEGKLAAFSRVIARGDDGLGPRLIYAGQQSRIRAYLDSHRDWASGGETDLVRRLIQLEITSSDGAVGGPVDLVRLTAAGAEWVQRKSQCRADR